MTSQVFGHGLVGHGLGLMGHVLDSITDNDKELWRRVPITNTITLTSMASFYDNRCKLVPEFQLKPSWILL